MHRSRLVAFVIDCQTTDPGAAAEFWGAALNRKPKTDADDARYVGLVGPEAEPMMMVQAVDHPSRIHLDIESDDVDAEVARLEKLGARRVQKVRTWWVMEAPSGHRFCVVRPQRGPLGADANEWP